MKTNSDGSATIQLFGKGAHRDETTEKLKTVLNHFAEALQAGQIVRSLKTTR